MEAILKTPVLRIMDMIADIGHEARVAGGSVRDVMLGEEPADIDLATTARPEVVQSLFEDVGYQVIPTGLQHGTVTVVMDDEHFEITTLRIDQNTDGRHAEVEFTDDWELDAARRDFTINAMFMDRSGKVHDYFDGMKDLKNFRVRFVGDPNERIQEDYLRILRFFRFKGRMIRKASWMSREERTAIEKHAKGLRQISGERIWSELQKIILNPVVSPVIRKMNQTGVTSHIGLGWLDDSMLLSTRRGDASPVTALTYSAAPNIDIVDLLNQRYHVSSEELRLAAFIRITKEYFDKYPDELTLDTMKTWLATGRASRRMVQEFLTYADLKMRFDLADWKTPEFPVRGQDLIDLGMTPGPDVGVYLNAMREKWVETQFEMDREALLSFIEPRINV